MSAEKHGPYLSPGTLVRYDGGEGGSEYGVVVHCWMNEEVQAHDCYVAFFGHAMPIGKPKGPPYVLRYFSTSLELVDDVRS